MKNEHGFKCPLNWDKLPINYRWIAIDANGEIYAYKNKPKILDDSYWINVQDFWFKGKTDPPADFKKCLWKRPKTQSE